MSKTKKARSSKAIKMEELTETMVTPEERMDMIAEAAYYRAEQRGFNPDGQIDDWLEAERIVDEMLEEAVKEATY